MDCAEIITKYLTDNGYDGLYDPDGECGCMLGDLRPCCEYMAGCIPGYLAPCDCGDHDYHIVATVEDRDATIRDYEEATGETWNKPAPPPSGRSAGN